MPKNNDNIKSKSTSRKPFRDVSNCRFKSTSVKKKSPDTTGEKQVSAGDALDRLLLAHSDLSLLVRQIDELVVQALNLKVSSKNERKEIESFANVLSQIQTSLKPWVPRFQKALSNHSTRSENQLEVCLANQTAVSRNEGTSEAPESPDEPKSDSLVSPSPLVSWRAECTTEGGKQLFLLTPLPTKGFSSRLQQSSKLAFENIAVHDPVPPHSNINPGGINIDVSDGVDLKPTSDKLPDPFPTNTKSNQDFSYVSPERFLKKTSCSMVVMTPCLKMSPPKSCILLEPISEYCHKNNPHARKATPCMGGVLSQNSEASCSQASKHLALKYPDIFGVKAAHKVETRKKTIEESPNWFISPPKTCILLEPNEDKQLNAAAVKDIQTSTLMKETDTQYGQISTKTSRNEVIELTPLWKDPDTTIQRGKRPGENTLKKELWTKFEAATNHGSRFNASIVKESVVACKDKGFLDRLEEVSYDETTSVVSADGIR